MKFLVFLLMVVLIILSFGCEDSLGIDPKVQKDLIFDDSGSGTVDPFNKAEIKSMRYSEGNFDYPIGFTSDVLEYLHNDIKIDITNGKLKILIKRLEVESMIDDLEIAEQGRYDRIKGFVLKTDTLTLKDSIIVDLSGIENPKNTISLLYRNFKNNPYEETFGEIFQSAMWILDRRQFGYIYFFFSAYLEDVPQIYTNVLTVEFKIYL